MDFNPQKIRDIKTDRGTIISKLFKLKAPTKTSMETSLTDDISNEELLENIRNAKSEWLDANMNFEYVGDKDIVDYYTYKILACQVRYEYFIKKAKEKGFKGEILA
jgi:hypothetical protein